MCPTLHSHIYCFIHSFLCHSFRPLPTSHFCCKASLPSLCMSLPTSAASTSSHGGIINIADLLVAFDDEIESLRAALRCWPPASDQISTGERVVALIRMRVQLRRSTPGSSVEMSPSSSSVALLLTKHLSDVTGLDDGLVGQLILTASELKMLEAQLLAGVAGAETKIIVIRRAELKAKQRVILSSIVLDSTQRAKL